MRLVAGVDSSTQSCKVVVREAETGQVVRAGQAAHPDGTEVHPDHWWDALRQAVDAAGGLQDVSAIGVGGQQHGMVCLDEAGAVVRPALLWNDTRSASAADELVGELGAGYWAHAVGSVPVASFTVTKLRWLAQHEPEALRRTVAVCLPHDWLTWKLRAAGLDALTTDRGDASGTGYWCSTAPAGSGPGQSAGFRSGGSPLDRDGYTQGRGRVAAHPNGGGLGPDGLGSYRGDLLELACGRGDLVLPTVLGAAEVAGVVATGAGVSINPAAIVSAGTGDNMAAALGLGARETDVIISVGTSGVVSVVSSIPTADPSGAVAGFADATGAYLPLACTLNAGQVLDQVRHLLGADFARLNELALQAPAGAQGLTLLPFFNGERTPNRPNARGVLAGITLENLTPANVARATVEGLACGLADGLDAIRACGVTTGRVLLVGGGAKLPALQQVLADVLGVPVVVPPTSEYVADGAAAQAAWALTGSRPNWQLPGTTTIGPTPTPAIREQYAQLRDATAPNAWPR